MKISFRHLLVWVGLAAFGVVGLAACGGDDSASGTGKVSLNLTDAPVDSAQSVVVQFSGVAFKREGEAAETITTLNPSPRTIDLLDYQGGQVAVLLNDVTLPAGRYEWVRLMVNAEPVVRDSYVVPDSGGECELRIPSGAESGLKLNRGFTLPADGSVALTIDFDLRQSLHAPPGQTGSGVSCTQGYLLRPTLRLVDNANIGAIAGKVDAALVTVGCTPAVYIYSGSGVTPDDIEDTAAGVDIDPLATATVAVVNGATQYDYKVAFLPVGAYTVAYTCGADDPTADNTLVFLGTQNVTVQNNLISTANFTVVPAI